MKHNKAPGRKTLQELQQYGLAVITMTPGVDPPIMVDSRWMPSQLNGFFRTKFPTLFQYFASIDPSILGFTTDSDPSYELPYVLLVAEDGILSVVPNCTNPDGARCRFNKGRDSAGWKESAIYLGMSLNQYMLMRHWLTSCPFSHP